MQVNHKKLTLVPFINLREAEVFRWDDKFFMKLSENHNAASVGKEMHSGANSVDLITGDLVRFTKDCTVDHVLGEFVASKG